MKKQRFPIFSILFPILALILFTPWSAQLDLMISKLFFKNDHFTTNAFFDFVYHYGLYLAWIIIGCSLLTLLIAVFYRSFRKWIKPALFLIFTLAIGSGLIIHAIFKDHWGRPRPRQVIEFGGQQAFRAYYEPNFTNQPEPSKSFPCGHCSMGFYFFSVALLGLYYRNKKVYYAGMITACLLGGLLGFIRIAQGGHFLSDVLVSALIMWLVSVGLYSFQFNRKRKCERINEKAA